MIAHVRLNAPSRERRWNDDDERGGKKNERDDKQRLSKKKKREREMAESVLHIDIRMNK